MLELGTMAGKQEAHGIPVAGIDSTEHTERIRKRLKWILYPNNRFLKAWDMLVLFLLFCLSWYLPYQIGVSGGYFLLKSNVWLTINVLINVAFVIDTFLYFFRAYYDDRGFLILDSRKIARTYVRSTFVFNLLSCFPSTLLFVFVANIPHNEEDPQTTITAKVIWLKVFDCLKFIRFLRVRSIMNESELLIQLTKRTKSHNRRLFKFVTILILVSHWIACMWSFTALVECNGFGNVLLTCDNWIGQWYSGIGAANTGIDPIGWDRSIDRYFLALFWSIQSLTSIGYGNIAPYTLAEWIIACILMLVCGISWAYILGSIISITASMQAREEAFLTRMDQANHLIKSFPKQESINRIAISEDHQLVKHTEGRSLVSDEDPINVEHVSESVREFLRVKYLRGDGDDEHAKATLVDCYQALETVPEELKKLCAVILVGPHINRIPYLHASLLSSVHRSQISAACTFMDFAHGEKLHVRKHDPEDQRGVYVFRMGAALVSHVFDEVNPEVMHRSHTHVVVTGGSFYSEYALFPTGHSVLPDCISVGFLTFSQVLFIPRSEILRLLHSDSLAWKSSGRWLYLRTLLKSKSYEVRVASMKPIIHPDGVQLDQTKVE
mmetsp:Transcript_20736/g.33787  ORF Transcript_20736/g.33787 Transcript_20736/m.33787 type:complete len:609 (+) Transcript_20736:367-2193(+)